MTLIPVGELSKTNMVFRDEDTGLEIVLAGATLTSNGVKGTVTITHNGSRIGRDYLLLSGRDRRRRLAKEVAGVMALADGQVDSLLIDLDDAAAEWLLASPFDGEAETPLTEEEEREALALLDDPELWLKIDNIISALGVAGEKAARKLIYLLFNSHLLPRPMSTAVKGPSAAGKSFLVDSVLRLFPSSAYYQITSASEKALIYTKADFRHRILVIIEAHESPFLEMLVRTLLSEGKIIYETVIEQEAVRLEKEGPTGLVVTTTQATLHEENETRVLSIFIRDDSIQTSAVMKETAHRFSANGARPEPNIAPFIAMQRWLEQSGTHDVVIPFADALVKLLPDKPIRWRRDVTQILTAIQSCALLYQRQRERNEDGRVIATLDDYEMVRPLLDLALAPSLAENLTEAQRAAVKAVSELTENSSETITISAVARKLNIDRSSASARLRSALEGGYVVNDEIHQNRPAKLRSGKETMPPPRVLPTPKEITEEVYSILPENPPPASTPEGEAVSEPDIESGVESGVELAEVGVGVEVGGGSGVESKSVSSQIAGVEAGSRFQEGDDTHAEILALLESLGWPMDVTYQDSAGEARPLHLGRESYWREWTAKASPDTINAVIKALKSMETS